MYFLSKYSSERSWGEVDGRVEFIAIERRKILFYTGDKLTDPCSNKNQEKIDTVDNSLSEPYERQNLFLALNRLWYTNQFIHRIRMQSFGKLNEHAIVSHRHQYRWYRMEWNGYASNITFRKIFFSVFVSKNNDDKHTKWPFYRAIASSIFEANKGKTNAMKIIWLPRFRIFLPRQFFFSLFVLFCWEDVVAIAISNSNDNGNSNKLSGGSYNILSKMLPFNCICLGIAS